MASLKDVKMKISGVRKTRQITRAMNMVASAKLRGAQARIERFRPYAEKYRSVMAGLASSADGESHPLLAEHAEKKHCCIIMATSDRGLCGGFNAGIINASLELAAGRSRAGLEPSFICVGRKGRDAIRKTPYPILRAYGDRMGSIDYALAGEVADEAIAAYERQELDEVWLVYGRFVSMAHQPPTESRLLPMQTPESTSTNLMKPGFWIPCCRAIFACRFLARCWRQRPASMRHAWPPWTTQPATAMR